MQYIGIDFGTTTTAVVCVQDDEFGRKIINLGEEGEYPFSSIVAIPKNPEMPLKFGREVRKQRLTIAETHEVYTSMKPFLGTSDTFIVGGKRYSPKDITTAFLNHIKDYIRQKYGITIIDAAFAFPVDFSPEARRELYEAASNAGIIVKAFVNESTAAYMANRDTGRALSRVMVLDWGGGTFDISILSLTKTSIHELSVWGEHIGGDDIDRELAERIHARLSVEASTDDVIEKRFNEMSPEERDQMIMRCENAKIDISDYEEDYQMTIHNYGMNGIKNVTITVEQFNDIVEPIIRAHILKAINNALNEAGGLSPALIDGVIIVGGSSNLRLFEYAVTNLFKNAKIIIPKKPQWSTATGAALMQIIGGNFQLSDAVGVILSDDSIYEILPRGFITNKAISPITFSLTEDNYDAHFIFTNSNGKTVYAKKDIPSKGFLKEELILSAIIGDDQIATITIENTNMSTEKRITKVELKKLTFHYDISALEENG